MGKLQHEADSQSGQSQQQQATTWDEFLLLFCCNPAVFSKCLCAGKKKNLSRFQYVVWWECDDICVLPKNPNRGGLGKQEEEGDVACV